MSRPRGPRWGWLGPMSGGLDFANAQRFSHCDIRIGRVDVADRFLVALKPRKKLP